MKTLILLAIAFATGIALASESGFTWHRSTAGPYYNVEIVEGRGKNCYVLVDSRNTARPPVLLWCE